jgi:hypothetical protein
LVRLQGLLAAQPCIHCGMVHEYLARPKHGGGCQPVLFPPGYASVGLHGASVEAFLVASDESAAEGIAAAAYGRLARQVAARGIRCERCGERFEDLDRYAVHQC